MRRDRAARSFEDHAFLIDYIADELVDRLDLVNRDFCSVLILGAHDGRLAARFARPDREIVSADPGFAFARTSRGVQCDEDRLPFADGSFDLVISVAMLDSVNDLPGALTLIRRALRPDGLLLGGFVGAGSLSRLKSALLAADCAVRQGAVARIHPQIDVRAAGDLLVRAGFALAVADSQRLDIGYGDPVRLMHDLRGMAATNILADRARGSPGGRWLEEIFHNCQGSSAGDGRFRETFEMVFLSGWSPGPGQPAPAKRGSATMSLGQALRAKR